MSLAAAADIGDPAPHEMRRAMGNFATGVTVVTGLSGGEPYGFACQSFASVSLEPPLVLFCADHRGRAWPEIQKAGRFAVNVLGEDQFDLGNRFGSSKGLKYTGLDWEVSCWGTPSLQGVLVRVHAEVLSVTVAGDHDIVLGRVLELETPGRGQPLLFFRGRFGVEPEDIREAPGAWGWQ